MESILIDEQNQNTLVVLVTISGWHLRVQLEPWQIERVQPQLLFHQGQQVKIIDGPFKNLTGVVEGVDLHLRKVRVTVSDAGQLKLVEVDVYELVRL